MRAINISNEKKRNAEVAFESITKKSSVRMVLPDGADRSNVKILRATLGLSLDSLLKKSGDLKALAQDIIDADPEIDIELQGRKLEATYRLYLDQNDKIAYRVNLVQVLHNPDGSEKERRDLSKRTSNINGDNMVQWTGKKMPKKAAIKKFVFTRKYQIKHVSGLTYDFLYQMAKDLHDTESMMMVGTGPKGNEPIVLTTGGEPYRGFLEGRIDGDKYCLILHLTNLEVKGL